MRASEMAIGSVVATKNRVWVKVENDHWSNSECFGNDGFAGTEFNPNESDGCSTDDQVDARLADGAEVLRTGPQLPGVRITSATRGATACGNTTMTFGTSVFSDNTWKRDAEQ